MRRPFLIAGALAVLACAVVWRAAPGLGARRGDASTSRVTGCAKGSPGAGDEAVPLEPPKKTIRDARQRNEVRERLREALGPRFPRPAPEAPKAAGTPPKPAASTPPIAAPPSGNDDSSAPPGIEPKYIQERVRQDFFPLARDCYTSLLKRSPKVGGRAEIHFTIVGDESIGGIVEDASLGDGSTLNDAEFDDCIRESMMTMTFPPPKGGGSVTVTYPVEFSAGDDDDDAGPPPPKK